MSKHKPVAQQTHVFQSNLFGIVMMMLHAVALSILYALVKDLTVEINSNIVVFLYKFAILIAVIPWCFKGGFESIKTEKLKLHMARGFVSVCGSLSMFYAIKHIALSDVTAVAYLEQIIMLLIGILYFKERATNTKIFVICISFVGAVLIIKSNMIYKLFGGHEVEMQMSFNTYYLFVFMAISFWALNNTVIKVLGKTEKTKVQLFYVMLFSCIIAFPIAFMEWTSFAKIGVVELNYPYGFIDFSTIGLTYKHLGIIAILALCYFLHVIGHFKALKHAELSVVIPFEYTRLVFAGILGYIFFGESPVLPSYIGYTLITIAGVLLFKSEHRKRKKQKRLKELESEFDQA